MNIEQIRADHNKHYGQTIIGFKSLARLLPFYVEDVYFNKERRDFYVKGQIGSDDNIWMPSIQPFNTEFFNLIYPSCGAINTQDIVVYITRDPARQWKIGIQNHYRTIWNNFEAECAALGCNIELSSPRFYYDWLNCKYDSAIDAYNKIDSGQCIASAINPRLYIGSKLGYKFPILFYKNNQVGIFKKEIVELSSSVVHLTEEISQYFPVEIK